LIITRASIVVAMKDPPTSNSSLIVLKNLFRATSRTKHIVDCELYRNYIKLFAGSDATAADLFEARATLFLAGFVVERPGRQLFALTQNIVPEVSTYKRAVLQLPSYRSGSLGCFFQGKQYNINPDISLDSSMVTGPFPQISSFSACQIQDPKSLLPRTWIQFKNLHSFAPAVELAHMI
jgi:hypothetical protein